MLKNLIIILCIIFLGGHPLFPTAEYFLLTDVGSSAEMIGIGNIEGFSKSSNSVFENPASLYRVDNYSTSFFTTTFMGEVVYSNVSAAYNTPWGVVAAGYMSTGVSGIPFTGEDRFGEFFVISFFNYTNALGKIAYQMTPAENFYVGAAGTWYQNEIADVTGTGYNIDAGMFYVLDELELSVFARNLITASKATYNNGGEEIFPLQVLYGLKYNYHWTQLHVQL
ncbi:MAG: hypothetical protein HRT90_10540, partial [Candidatus Margulisbacteria bacterium]|nr:hypothetical protein [Candidatus Margulisiibacteriota bacterium]